MKKPSRFLRLIGIAGLLATLLAGVFATPIAYAGEPDPNPSDDGNVGDIWDGTDPLLLGNEGGIYFPWVGNDDESTGLGPADTSVSVMNISDEPAIAFAWVGTHDSEELPDTGSWDIVGPFFLAPWASKTFTAAQLGIAEGTGAPVAFAGYNQLEGTSVCEVSLGGPLEEGVDANGNGDCDDVEVYVGSDEDDESDPALCRVDDENGDRTANYQGVQNGGGGLNDDGDCNDAEQGADTVTIYDTTVLGGYAKQAVDGETLPYTTAADSSVSGYNSIGGFEIVEFDDWYFPIAQTNCGPGGCWNTILRIANFGQEVDGEIGNIGSAAVTAAFFPSDDAQGSLDTGFQLQALVNTGDVWNIDISDYVPEGWVGSVHVYSDSAVFAMADRVKVGYGAWITNTASSAPHTVFNNVPGDFGQYVLFAPDVRLDFFGWNTGINVANLVNDDNNVNIQYFNLYGNAPSTLTRRLAPQGMTYFYDPSQAPQDNSVQNPAQDVNSDVIGSALIWSDYPVAVAVDATKYPESTTSDDPNIFQAMSYSATANVYTTQAFPLVQKGNPTTGQGATSGINVMNPNSTAAQATVWWVNPSGFGADNFGTSAVAIPGFANGFVYTMTQGNLPNGFYGSAVLTSTLPVAAVTTQVDYQVEWDGTAVWLAYNPCGYYRDNGFDDRELEGFGSDFNCNLGDPFNTSGGQITKIVQDELGNPIAGVAMSLVNEAYYQHYILENESFAGVDWSGVGYSSIYGEIEWTNVPAGTYYLIVDAVPTTSDNDVEDLDLDMYEGAGVVEGPFTLNTGEDLVVENELDGILPEKLVLLGDDAAGVPVCLVEADDIDDEFVADDDTEAVDCETADADGEAAFADIVPGWYFVTVNYGFDDVDGEDYVALNGISSFASDAEYFGLGGVYINDYAGDVNVAEGSLQKIILLPEELCGDFLISEQSELQGEISADACPGVTIEGGIAFLDANGDLEAEGNVQTVIVEAGVGPEGTVAFSLTDVNVPVGGPYTIEELLEITYDLDGPGGDDPTTVTIDRTLETAEDGQEICPTEFAPSADCEASPADPDIYVYEDMTTRVFNDFTDIVTGQLDVFVRDEETDQPLDFALVCIYDEVASEIVGCDLTDGDGQAEFPDLPEGFYSLTAGHPDYEVQGSGTIFYVPAFDAFLGGGMDDELGDVDPFLGQQDIQLALDPTGTFLDVLVGIDDGDGIDGPEDGVNGIDVFLYLAGPAGDTPGPGGTCDGGSLVAVQTSATMDVGGEDVDGMVQFGVDFTQDYCILSDPNGDSIVTVVSPASVGQNDPQNDIDYFIVDGGSGVLDVHYTLDGAGLNGALIFLFVDDPADVSGGNGTGVCGGTPVLVGSPALTTTQLVSGQGTVDGIASFTVDTSLVYCASTVPGGPGSADADISLDPADQDDDIDATIADTTVII